MMDEKKIARINQLAAKSKTAEGLTPEEKQEQLALRREYIPWWEIWPGSWITPMWWTSTATSASSAGRERSNGLFL